MTSLRVSLSVKGRTPFSSSLIDSRRVDISFLALRRKLANPPPSYSSTMYGSYMAHLRTPSQTEEFSSTIVLLNVYTNSLTFIPRCRQHTIQSQMVRLKESIRYWKIIFATSSLIGKMIGWTYCQSQSGLITTTHPTPRSNRPSPFGMESRHSFTLKPLGKNESLQQKSSQIHW